MNSSVPKFLHPTLCVLGLLVFAHPACAQDRTISGNITLLDGITPRAGRQVDIVVRSAENGFALKSERQMGPAFKLTYNAGLLPSDNKSINVEIIDVLNPNLRAELKSLNGLVSHDKLDVGIQLDSDFFIVE